MALVYLLMLLQGQFGARHQLVQTRAQIDALSSALARRRAERDANDVALSAVGDVKIQASLDLSAHTHTHPFNGPLSATTRESRCQTGKTNLDFTEARDSEWQWHRLGRMQVCTSLQTDNHASTPPLKFLQAGCPSCRPTNSVKALKALSRHISLVHYRTSTELSQ